MKTWSRILLAASALFLVTTGLRAQSVDRGALIARGYYLATGIGQAFAVGCAAQGANVVVADLNLADETVALIERAGGRPIAEIGRASCRERG